MSIYATYWVLRFPRYGDAHTGCDWVSVLGQAVPAHCGSSEAEPDPYAEFLPAFDTSVDRDVRALVVVVDGTPKDGQRYTESLLVLSGKEYFSTTFDELHERICDRLRGDRPRWLGEVPLADGRLRILFEDGSSTVVVPGAREE